MANLTHLFKVGQIATVVKNGVVERIGRSSVYVPNTNFKGGSIKWYEDKPKKADK